MEGTVIANRRSPDTPDGTLVGTGIGYGATGLVANTPDFGLALSGAQSISIPDSSLINTYVGNATSRSIELWFRANSVTQRQVLFAR